MATTQQEIHEQMQRIKPIVCDALPKTPVTKWELDTDGEPEQVTSITLIIKDISPRDLRRLAQAALSKIQVEVEMAPRMEQTSFDDED